MPNYCGKSANSTWIMTWIQRVDISTFIHHIAHSALRYCAHYEVIPHILPYLFQLSSTTHSIKLPLVEYIFYPISTPPIINTAKIIS
jgi:hypothetical protein